MSTSGIHKPLLNVNHGTLSFINHMEKLRCCHCPAVLFQVTCILSCVLLYTSVPLYSMLERSFTLTALDSYLTSRSVCKLLYILSDETIQMHIK